jgi:hypothetical protein
MDKPFLGQISYKRTQLGPGSFFTHPSTTCNMSVTDGTELIQRCPIPGIFGCVEEAQKFGATKKAWEN